MLPYCQQIPVVNSWYALPAATAAGAETQAWDLIFMQKNSRARAVAIAKAMDDEKFKRLRFLAIAIGASAAFLSLPAFLL
jgi:hypothetical protein